MASSSIVTQPNTTLYINNLNDQIQKEEIRAQLFALFTTYGKVIDVVASKTPKMRGQAFLVFTDLAAATSALRATDGMLFYDKPLVRLFLAIVLHTLSADTYRATSVCTSHTINVFMTLISAFNTQKQSHTRPCVAKTPTSSLPPQPTVVPSQNNKSSPSAAATPPPQLHPPKSGLAKTKRWMMDVHRNRRNQRRRKAMMRRWR